MDPHSSGNTKMLAAGSLKCRVPRVRSIANAWRITKLAPTPDIVLSNIPPDHIGNAFISFFRSSTSSTVHNVHDFLRGFDS